MQQAQDCFHLTGLASFSLFVFFHRKPSPITERPRLGFGISTKETSLEVITILTVFKGFLHMSIF